MASIAVRMEKGEKGSLAVFNAKRHMIISLE